MFFRGLQFFPLDLVILFATVVKIGSFAAEDGVTGEALGPSKGSPLNLTTCRTSLEGAYRCVRLEDCHVKKRMGGKRFCGWEGKPSHICCLQTSSAAKRLDVVIRERRESYDLDEEETTETDTRSPRFRNNGHNYGLLWPHHIHSRGPERHWGSSFGDSRNSETRQHAWHDHHYGNGVDNHHSLENIDTSAPRDYGYEEIGTTVRSSDNRGFIDEECGVLDAEKGDRILAAAIGGFPVKTAASNPWMVAIGQRTSIREIEWFCGGVLLNQRVVLTAAHCVTKGNPNTIRVGDLDLYSTSEQAEPQDSGIESTHVYPEHKRPAYYNDIAVVRLTTPVRYTKYVRPICLPSEKSKSYENAQATLTGWGVLEYGGDPSPVLQEVHMTVLDNSKCNETYSSDGVRNSNNLPNGIIETQLCAGDKNGGRDACQGDSGGPLIVQEGRRRVVIGVVSSGLGCGSRFYPGIYTRVSHYVDWIQTFLNDRRTSTRSQRLIA